MYLNPINTGNFVQPEKPKGWLSSENNFEYLWLSRLTRIAGRKMAADVMDYFLPLPKKYKKKISKLCIPAINKYHRDGWYYSDLITHIKKRSVGSWWGVPKKLFINRRIYESAYDLFEGGVWGVATRQGMMILNIFDAGRYAYKALVLNENRESNLKMFYRQALKWTIGNEFASLGFSIGVMIAKRKKAALTTGLFTSVLFSSLFDKALHFLFNKCSQAS